VERVEKTYSNKNRGTMAELITWPATNAMAINTKKTYLLSRDLSFKKNILK
jgi:hypothetical protein